MANLRRKESWLHRLYSSNLSEEILEVFEEVPKPTTKRDIDTYSYSHLYGNISVDPDVLKYSYGNDVGNVVEQMASDCGKLADAMAIVDGVVLCRGLGMHTVQPFAFLDNKMPCYQGEQLSLDLDRVVELHAQRTHEYRNKVRGPYCVVTGLVSAAAITACARGGSLLGMSIAAFGGAWMMRFLHTTK